MLIRSISRRYRRISALATTLLAMTIIAFAASRWIQYHMNILEIAITREGSGLTRKDLNDALTDMVRTVGALIGGVGLFGTLYFTWRNHLLAQSGQVSDRFAKAVELLGALHPQGKLNLEARIGAMYALERIALDSSRDHWQVMEVLTAYIREHARRDPELETSASDSDAENLHPREDIHTAVTVVARRNYRRDPYPHSINLRGVDLRGAILAGAHFERTNLRDANLERASLEKAHLEGAQLSGARLVRANCTDIHLDNAHMAGTDMERAHLLRAQLKGAFLGEAIFRGAKLIEANLHGATCGAFYWSGADFTNAYIRESDLRGTGMDAEQLMLADVHSGRNRLDPDLRATVERLRAERDAARASDSDRLSKSPDV